MEIRRVGIEAYRIVEESSSLKGSKKRHSVTSSSDKVKDVATEITLSSLSVSREERLEEIKFLIENGLYRIDSKAISENILEELLNG